LTGVGALRLLVYTVQAILVGAAFWLLLQIGRRILGMDTAPGLTWQRLMMVIAVAALLSVAYGLRRSGWVRRAASWYVAISRRRPWIHVSFPLLLVVGLVLAEVGLRIAYRYEGAVVVLDQPYLGFGRLGHQDERLLLEGPESFGYRQRDGRYVFDIREAVSGIQDRGDFLFGERAPIANRPGAAEGLRVFILGGSAAFGVGATSPERTWWVHLENGLSSELGRKVSVLNAAVPGFVSTQERIMLDLMVLPRKPDLVVFLHGLNDISIPMGYGVRPGDPFTQAVTYRASSSLAFDVLRRAARVSFIASSLTNWLMTPPPEGYYPELATNLGLVKKLFASGRSVRAEACGRWMPDRKARW
jgi:hypothetical protein